MTPDLDAAHLYDAFLTRLKSDERDVASWIEAACPAAIDLTHQLLCLNQFKAWLDGFRPLPAPVVEELRRWYTVSLTFHSNALEGNTLSQSETEMVMAYGITVGGHSLVEHLEVIGHRDAMTYMEELARDEAPLSEREIKDLHSLIVRPAESAIGQNEAGVFRTLDVRASGTGYLYPPHYRLRELMDEFIAWLGSEEAKALHPVEYASEAHFRFVPIHPFRDGNKRTARLLMNLCLIRAGYPITVIPTQKRAGYLDALVRGQGGAVGAQPLAELVAHCCRESFVETLRLLSTAPSSRGQSAQFYRALLDVAPQLPS